MLRISIGDEHSGRAVVVDPQRDISGYLADAQDFGLAIERVIETHFRADFLSGHLELASQSYDSLHGKLLRLPDATRVFPAIGCTTLLFVQRNAKQNGSIAVG